MQPLPSAIPSSAPTSAPSLVSSSKPSLSPVPTSIPSSAPSFVPSSAPTSTTKVRCFFFHYVNIIMSNLFTGTNTLFIRHISNLFNTLEPSSQYIRTNYWRPSWLDCFPMILKELLTKHSYSHIDEFIASIKE